MNLVSTMSDVVVIAGWVILYVLINGVLSWVLSELAGRRFGQPTLWFIGFFFAPGIMHLVWLLFLINSTRMQKLYRKAKNLDDLKSRSAYLMEREKASRSDGVSVTPFTSSGQMPSPAEASAFGVLDEWRDKTIEELLEWKQNEKALELARQRLDDARNAGDTRSTEVYEAYVRMLKPSVEG